jgi:hypothetical protein
MKNNFKYFQRQLDALELALNPPDVRGLIWRLRLSQAPDCLAPGKRIVEDYYTDTDGTSVIIAERITSDPSDKGKDYAHGSWDRKWLDSLNRHPHEVTGIVWTTERPKEEHGDTEDGDPFD